MRRHMLCFTSKPEKKPVSSNLVSSLIAVPQRLMGIGGLVRLFSKQSKESSPMPLKKFLENLSEELSSRFYFINSGGCGAMACIVYRKLEKILPVELVIKDWGSYTIEDLRTRITNPKPEYEDWNRHGLYFGHVFLLITLGDTQYGWDSDELFEYDPMRQDYKRGFKIDDLERISFRQVGWNSTFDRKQIPKIKKYVDSLNWEQFEFKGVLLEEEVAA